MNKKGKRVAIVIGIGNYIHYNPLEYCPLSAKDVFNLLISPSYGCCDPDLSIYITDDNFPIRNGDIDSDIKKVIKDISVEDQFFFFFSGHAEVHKNDLYLLLSDTDSGNHWGVSSYNFSILVKNLNSHNVNKSILIIDACHSGMMFNSIKNYQSNWTYKGLPSGMAMMSSSKKTEYSSQDPSLRRTLFSYYFCEGIRNNVNDYYYLPEVAEYINNKINNNHPEHRQTAQTFIRDTGEQIWLTNNVKKITNKKTSYFPFSNRENEVKQLLNLDTTSNYYLIDSPPGYGKTFLLKNLENKFKRRKWQCAHVRVGQDDTIDLLINKIIKYLYPKDKKIGSDIYNINYKHRLSSKLKENWQNKETKKFVGIVLLIDFDKSPKLDLVNNILNDIIPNIYEGLNELEIFSNRKKHFRVIFSGRYLSNTSEFLNSIPINTYHLLPFNYKTIQLSLRFFLKGDHSKIINNFAADLLYFTGGHPYCVAELSSIKKKYGLPQKALFSKKDEFNYFKIIDKKSNEIYDNKIFNTEKYRSILNEISIFRFFDRHILKDLFKNENILSLTRVLTQTNLIERKGRFFENNISRRLLVISFRKNEKESFLKSVGFSIKVCINRVKKLKFKGDTPEKWVIEYLFQILQINFIHIEGIENRKNLKIKFEQEVINIILLYIGNQTDVEEIITDQYALIYEMEKDWEFQFTVNYYLRRKYFNSEPYKKIKSNINAIFKKHIKEIELI